MTQSQNAQSRNVEAASASESDDGRRAQVGQSRCRQLRGSVASTAAVGSVVGLAASAVGAVGTASAHGGAGTNPVGIPHWTVLIVAVLGLWTVIGLGILVADRALRGVLGAR